MGRLSCGYPICSWAETPATRANIRTVFDLFAGRPVPGSARMALPTKIRDRIRQAAEDDLVLISFSGHGRTNDRGQFFIQKGRSALVHTEMCSALRGRLRQLPDSGSWPAELLEMKRMKQNGSNAGVLVYNILTKRSKWKFWITEDISSIG